MLNEHWCSEKLICEQKQVSRTAVTDLMSNEVLSPIDGELLPPHHMTQTHSPLCWITPLLHLCRLSQTEHLATFEFSYWELKILLMFLMAKYTFLNFFKDKYTRIGVLPSVPTLLHSVSSKIFDIIPCHLFSTLQLEKSKQNYYRKSRNFDASSIPFRLLWNTLRLCDLGCTNPKLTYYILWIVCNLGCSHGEWLSMLHTAALMCLWC